MEKSAQIQRWIDQAESLGLEVDVDSNDDHTIQSWRVTIRRPQVDAVTMLDVYNNSERVYIHGWRYRTNRWSHAAYRASMGTKGDGKLEKLALVKYCIDQLGEHIERCSTTGCDADMREMKCPNDKRSCLDHCGEEH